MKKQLFLLFLLLFTVLISNLAFADYDAPCCIKTQILPTDKTKFVVPNDDGDCNTLYIKLENCYDKQDKDNPFDISFLETGCCCNEDNKPITLGNDEQYQQFILKSACNLDGASFAEFSKNSNCDAICGSDDTSTGDTTPVQTSSVHVTGYVFANVSGIVKPYEGAIVMSLIGSQNSQVSSGSSGLYDLGNVPGEPTGTNSFSASIPQGRDIACESLRQDILLSQDIEINFTLNCWKNEESCTPDWEYGAWGDCMVVGDSAFKMRSYSDKNDCNTLTGLEPVIDFSDCDGQIRYGACGNGQLDVDAQEQCDLEDESYKFLSLDGTKKDSISCASLDGDLYADGAITCSNLCKYDYSSCETICDKNRCRNAGECGKCPACEKNTIICEDTCDEEKPEFLDDWRDNLESSRNVFDLYTLRQGKSPQAEVSYLEGTNDVNIQWIYNPQCENSVNNFKIKICEEDSSTPNSCKFQTTQERIASYGERSIKIKDLLDSHKSYCYNVCAEKISGKEVCAFDASEKLPCFVTGDEECMVESDEPGLNCRYDDEKKQMLPKGCLRDSFGYTNLSFSTPEAVSDCSGKICVETEFNENIHSLNYLGAMCVAKPTCGTCNGLFGMYANYDLSVLLIDSDNDELSVQCSDMEYSFSGNPSLIPSVDNFKGRCYKDKTRTIFEKFDTCELIKSCYDYNSEEACLNDPCFRFVNISTENPEVACEWEPILTKTSSNDLTNELGLGVCKPKNSQKEDCTRCDTKAPFNFCNEQECGLYGSCYFKNIPNHDKRVANPLKKIVEEKSRSNVESLIPTCVNDENMACYLYDTETECEGGREVVVDVIYDNSQTIVNSKNSRIAGSNKLTKSNDVLHFGTCRWVDNDNVEIRGCVKDADGSKSYELSNLYDDCKSGEGVRSLECIKDNTPPITNVMFKKDEKTSKVNNQQIPIYGIGEFKNLEFVPEDDVSPTEKITTKISLLSLESCSRCVPSFIVNNLSISQKNKKYEITNSNFETIRSCYERKCNQYPITDLSSSSNYFNNDYSHLSSGEYVLMYYSEDEAKNLEEVQLKQIYIDNTPPEIIINKPEFNSYKDNGNDDDYRTDVNISFSVDEKSLCEGYLVNPNNVELRANGVKDNALNFETHYFKLLDGYYTFKVTCIDDHQNEATLEKEISVEGDASITNPQPRGEIFSSIEAVNSLSIQTSLPATCYYSFNQNEYPSDQKFVQSDMVDGKYDHTITFSSAIAGSVSGNQRFALFTKCDFSDGTTTEGSFGDVIWFAIDSLAPTSEIKIQEGSSWVPMNNVVDFADEREIQLSCNDNYPTSNLNYGCDRIEYCFADFTSDLENFNVNDCDGNSWFILNTASGLSNPDAETGERSAIKLIKQEEIGFGKRIYFRAVDGNGNTGSVKRLNLGIKNTNFADPEFTVSRLLE